MSAWLSKICLATGICLLLASSSQAYDEDQLRELVKFPVLYFSFSVGQPGKGWMEHASDSPIRLNGLVRIAVIEAAKRYPNDVDHLWGALSPEEHGEFTGYQQKLTAMLDSAGQDAWRVHEALGLILYIRGDRESGLEHFRIAFDANPSADAAYSALLVDLREKGKLAEAAVMMERRVRSLKSAEERLRLSRLYAELGRLDLAEKHCRAALRLRKPDDDWQAHQMMGVLILKRYSDLKLAAYHLEKALAIGPKDDMGDCRFALGVAYLLQGDRERAMEALKEAGTPEAEKLLRELTGGRSRNVPSGQPVTIFDSITA